jgi:hypothetical protein
VTNTHIAAIIGVLSYLREEEEKIKLAAEKHKIPYRLINRWSLYGRQSIMQLRSKVQRRILEPHVSLPYINVSVPDRGILLHRAKNLVITPNRIRTQARQFGNPTTGQWQGIQSNISFHTSSGRSST